MTIKELYEQNGGREGVARYVKAINSDKDIWGNLTLSEKEILVALQPELVVERLKIDTHEETWIEFNHGNLDCYGCVYRVRPDYVLPEDEPEVFWGSIPRSTDEKSLYYKVPDVNSGTFRWDTLAGWAEANGWEFHGFYNSKGTSLLGSTDPFTKKGGDSISIRPFAKFVKSK